MKKYFVFITFLVLVLNCSRDKNPLGPSSTSDFAIYFLKDSFLRTSQAMQQDLAKIELETDPWLSSQDINFYDFSTHCIYLKTDKSDFFENFDDNHFNPILIDKPFVVVAGGTRCYLGSLHSGALSTIPPGPYMDELDVWHYPKDVMHISKAWVSDQDVRSDDRIKNALIQLNLFHGGLSVELNAVEIIENADTSTVQYSFTIMNNDQDNLYIIDPDLMGSELFHYYTNGVVFWNEITYYLGSEYKTVISPDPYYSWQPDWFTKLKSKRPLQRTVILKGYPKIPKGRYSCYFTFSGPPKIERDQRILSDGRYWIGQIVSNKIEKIVN